MLDNIVSTFSAAAAFAVSSNIAFAVGIVVVLVGAVYVLLKFSFINEMTETLDTPFITEGEAQKSRKSYVPVEKAIGLANSDRVRFFYFIAILALAIIANEWAAPFGNQTRKLSWFFLIGAFAADVIWWLAAKFNRGNFDRKYAEYAAKLAPNEG